MSDLTQAPDSLETILGEAIALAEGAAGVRLVRELKARQRELIQAGQAATEGEQPGGENGA